MEHGHDSSQPCHWGYDIAYGNKMEKWWFAEFEYAYNRGDDTIDFGDLMKNMVSLGVGLNF